MSTITKKESVLPKLLLLSADTAGFGRLRFALPGWDSRCQGQLALCNLAYSIAWQLHGLLDIDLVEVISVPCSRSGRLEQVRPVLYALEYHGLHCLNVPPVCI